MRPGQIQPNDLLIGITFASFGLLGIATAQLVRLYIAASGEHLAKPCALTIRWLQVSEIWGKS
jgi:hypothetical protein